MPGPRCRRRYREEARPADAFDWSPPLLPAVATRDEGIAGIIDATDRHGSKLRDSGEFARMSGRRERAQALALMGEEMLRIAMERADAEVLSAVEARQIDPYEAARLLVHRLSPVQEE